MHLKKRNFETQELISLIFFFYLFFSKKKRSDNGRTFSKFCFWRIQRPFRTHLFYNTFLNSAFTFAFERFGNIAVEHDQTMAAFVSFRTGNILTGTGAALQALRRVVVTESVTVGMAALRFGAVVLEFAYQDLCDCAFRQLLGGW